MRLRPSPVEALVTLPRVSDVKEREGRWRQAVAALAQHVRADGPPPLDGLQTEELVGACETALQAGLVDDLDWIAPGAAAVALYELTTALPTGVARREFARRVFTRLYGGNASTFAPVATRMALGSGKQLHAATMRARISLLFALPIGSSVHADPLALSLVLRREQFARWVHEPSTGALPARRLAAILIERAAREAVTRMHRGDRRPREVLLSDEIQPTFDALLSDREPQVWRHAAVARGILAAVAPKLRQSIDLELDPGLTPTEWRRAAVSLMPCLLWDYETTMAQCRQLLASDIAKHHPSIVSTMLWGLGPVIEAEPDAAEEILNLVSTSQRLDVAESMAALINEVENRSWGLQAAARMQHTLARYDVSKDAALGAIVDQAIQSLGRRVSENTVRSGIQKALLAFETDGALQAYESAAETMIRAEGQMRQIRALDSQGPRALPAVYPLLFDLDAGALERSLLHDLLLLGRRPGEKEASVPELEALYDDLGGWLLQSEELRTPGNSTHYGEILYRQRKLVSLLHLVDVETAGASETANERVKERVQGTIAALLMRLSSGSDPTLHRVLCATLARCLDSAVREQVADPADLLLLLMQHIHANESLLALTEASTNRDVREELQAYARYVGNANREAMDSIADGTLNTAALSQSDRRQDDLQAARSLIDFSLGIGSNGSYRGEALRQVILRLGRGLEVVATARSMTDLTADQEGQFDVIREIEHGCEALRKLLAGVNQRVLNLELQIEVTADVTPLSALVDRTVGSNVPANTMQLSRSIGEVTADLPPSIAVTVASILGRIATLPLSPPSNLSVIPLKKRRSSLPDWLLPRKTIGGFYVVRALGTGGVSSVFVARRIEERNRVDAELYALKVPQYDPTTARSLSEQEFMDMFREEAGALLSLPKHQNLASFVNFDLSARPKPILVMELIQGQSLDRLVRNRSMSVGQVLGYLDGILAGLEAMHQVGIGHLDVKPSNVILRDDGSPALVDFGLSGRHLRPGCGTLEYCAPEVLGIAPKDHALAPVPTDIYAFGCCAYELLTAELLFDSDDEAALIAQHVSHDGWPKKLAEFGAAPQLTELAALIGACIRRDPRNRPSARETRKMLRAVTDKLKRLNWPLSPTTFAEGISA